MVINIYMRNTRRARVFFYFLYIFFIFWVNIPVLIRVSIATTKHHDQKSKIGGKGLLYYTSTLLFTTEESQDRDSNRAGSGRQELMQRPWRGVACWLASPGLLIPPSYRTQDRQPRDGTTHHGLGPPTMVTKWEDVLQLNLMEAFPHLRLLSLVTLAHVKLTYKTSKYSTLVS